MPNAVNDWLDPLALTQHISQQHTHCILLYSGLKTSYSGRYSYLAFDLQEQLNDSNFERFSKKLTDDSSTFDNAWFGYLGYELHHALEAGEPGDLYGIELPALCMMRFGTVIQFDHQEKKLRIFGASYTPPHKLEPTTNTVPTITAIRSNMSKNDYLTYAQQVIDAIGRGDLSQANLTRKFEATSDTTTQPFTLFARLCDASPAPYSAYIQLGERAIISSSPEQFLQITATGSIHARPIKGSAPREAEPHHDDQQRAALANSTKDRAENLMIVDLMRNDISRAATTGSVHVPDIFNIDSYETIHHMSSTITGQKRDNASTLDTIKHCFPPGSMTGTPKLKAIELCSQLEDYQRQAYSGAIGWFGGDGSCDLSVVIRTIITDGTRHEFQVGGGIVWDSTPQGEWQETIDKAAGICTALGITRAQLEAL